MCALTSEALIVRPSELLAIVCRLGAGHPPDNLGDKRLTAILREVRAHPRRRTRLFCYDECFASSSALKRDPNWENKTLRDHMIRDIIKSQFLYGFAPSANTGVLITALMVLVCQIATVEGLIVFNKARHNDFPEYPDIKPGDYEKGREIARKLLESVLPSYYRSAEQLKLDKATSVREVAAANELRIFPSHVLFLVAHYGSMLDVAEPYPVQDNFNELFRAMKANPEIPVRLVDRFCMVCPPCPSWDSRTGLCRLHAERPAASEYGINYGALLRLVRDWGMRLDEPMPAAKFLRKLFDVPTAKMDWYWYSEGSPASVFHYSRGKAAGLGFLDAYENLPGVLARVGKLLADKGIRELLPPADLKMMTAVLDEARVSWRKNDRRKAYITITNERFWNCWKGYLEHAAIALACLPRAVRCALPEQVKGLPVLTVRRTTQTIRCNGCLEDKVWRQGAFVAGFRTSAERPAIMETAVQALYDRRCLRLACVCADPDTRKIKAEARVGADILPRRNSTNMWAHADDSMLFCVQPDESAEEYFVFRFNPKGTKSGQRFSAIPGGWQSTGLYDVDWRVDVKVRRGAWSASVALPFKLLGATPGQSRRWRINFYRIVRNDMAPPSAWSYGIRVSHNQLKKYGYLRFV